MMNPNIGELGSDKNQDTGFRDNTPQTPRLGFWSSHTGNHKYNLDISTLTTCTHVSVSGRRVLHCQDIDKQSIIITSTKVTVSVT